MLFSLLFACTGKSIDSGASSVYTFPSIDSMPSLRGPGGPDISFNEEQLFSNCASLTGSEEDDLHHNLVLPYRGHLVLPWAPEWGRGGLSFFDVSDPCQPQKEGEGFHERMRESHTIGFMYLSEEEEYALTAGILGIQFWDISTLESPEMINYMQIEGVFYPDSYTRVVLSTFWQYPWVYIAAADNGIFIVNAEDPHNPEYIGQYQFDPPMRTAGVFAMGTHLLVTSAEGNQAEILDISDPANPQPIGGGRFTSVDSTGTPYEAYHANLVGNWALFARKEDGGGIIAMDVSDPSNPTYLWDVHTEGGNSGYVFYDEGYAFLGDSHWSQFARASKRVVPTSPSIDSTNLPTISPTQTFLWSPSGGSWIQIRMYQRDTAGNLLSDINCNVTDDGQFTVSDVHSTWITGDIIYIQFTRVYENSTVMGHNNAQSRIIGEHIIVGAGVMN